MDIAGLAVGAAALVGVLEDFVSILARIDAAKSMKRDYDTLVTKLGMHKALLDKLAKEVQLPDPKEKDLIIRSIECVRNLLEDAEKLQRRYSITPAKFHETVQLKTAPTSRSISRLHRISQRLRSLRGVQQNQSDQHTQSSQSASKSHKNKYSGVQKLAWTTKDKEQFEGLANNATELIKLICLLTLPSNIGLINALQWSEKEKLRSSHESGTIENIASKDHNDSASRALEPECVKRILKQLWFRFIDDRKKSVGDAHSKTFQWAIRRPAPETKWDDLRQWLRSGNDIYWISGKPGSGKSTLMKYLFGHPEVSELLQEWAGNQKLTMASFFLWNVGTSEQNTQHGLARGLLYHVLKENPSLIPVVLPDMWQEAQKSNIDVKPPSNTELDQAFQQLGNQSTEGVFAFFIDGIDEFKGNYREGISFIQKLADSARIKILLSSREINECITAFSMKPKMRLQDLTKKDIKEYVNDGVRSHLSLPGKSQLSETDIRTLIKTLLDKAEGVFLWVFLACRTLRDRFDACEKAKKLQQVVDELPRELEDLFRRILESVPRADQHEAAELLKLCHFHGSHYDDTRHPITTFSLAWASEKDMSLDKMHDFTRFSHDAMRQQCETFEVRLRSLCRGLLEVNGDSSNGSPSYIGFMHRTVFEFLDGPGVTEMDCLKIHNEEFDPVTIIAYMYVHELYLSQESVVENFEVMYILSDPFDMVYKFSPSKLPQVLDKFVLALMEPRRLDMWETEAPRNQYLPVCLAGTSSEKFESVFGYSQHELSREHAALLLAVELHLYDVVKDFDIAGFNTLQISQHPDATDRRNLLFYAIEQPTMRLMDCDFVSWEFSSEMIETLLHSGCDPNQVIERQEYMEWDRVTTPWHEWLSWLSHSATSIKGINRVQKISFVTAKMLEAGADLYPKITTSHGDLRVYLIEKLEKWMEVSEQVNSKERFLQIGESCKVIYHAIRSSLDENPEIIQKSDQYKEGADNEGDDEIEDSEKDGENKGDDEEYDNKDEE